MITLRLLSDKHGLNLISNIIIIIIIVIVVVVVIIIIIYLFIYFSDNPKIE